MATSSEITNAIAAADDNFMATFKRGDAAGMSVLYTENGQLLPPNSDFITGKQEADYSNHKNKDYDFIRH